MTGYFLGLVLLGTFLPVGVSLVACAAFLGAYLFLCRLPARASVRFLWRQTGTVRVRSLTWSDWVSGARGGDGAVRELVEMILKAQGRWESVVAAYATEGQRA